MKTPPGFFAFRWKANFSVEFEDIAFVFKVPGAVDLAVLPDVFEGVCRGPVVPHAVVLVNVAGDLPLQAAIGAPATEAAMLRFDGRLPLLQLEIDPRNFRLKLHRLRGDLSRVLLGQLAAHLEGHTDGWLKAGLTTVFDADRIVVSAPAGYAFKKPSSSRATYFIRTDQALTTSASVSFVALAALRRLLLVHEGPPHSLSQIFVDTMSVATAAYALRELLAQAGVTPLPQIESFHSYGGMAEVCPPLPGRSLCLISASTSMNLHREWVECKRVYDRDVLTLVTFDDVEGKENALFALPSLYRPAGSELTAKYDIQISGENFFPMNEPPRKVLLSVTHHACPRLTGVIDELKGLGVYNIFRPAGPSGIRRALAIDGRQLLETHKFRHWLDKSLPHWLKAGTTQVLFQDDATSKVVAQHLAHVLVELGNPAPQILCVEALGVSAIDPNGALVAVATVVGRGNRLLALSRELRNVHRGPRLYVVGLQVAESEAAVMTFDRNLKHSAVDATIDVLRMHTCLTSNAVLESFSDEAKLLESAGPLPAVVESRLVQLMKGTLGQDQALFWPAGSDLHAPLVLNEGFAFWKAGYAAGPYQAEVLATISAILQNARTSITLPVRERLRSPVLAQVALDPENFSRFNDPVIQASILRAALPSELDYRGDADTSRYMRIFLERMAARMGDTHQAELEFLVALATRRLRLVDKDEAGVIQTFSDACRSQKSPLAVAVRLVLGRLSAAHGQTGGIW